MSAKILVVDDSPTVGSCVVWLLSDHAYEVRVAEDGLTALSILHSFHADLILLDIKLPHIDGFKLCEMLRRNPRYGSVPIIMLSGMRSEESIQRAMDLGANDYICKPFADDRLLEAIEKALVSNATHAV